MPSQDTPVNGYVDPNFPDPMGSNDASIIIYGYVPSLALAVLGTVLFSLAAAVHSYRLLRYRTWYFLPVVVGTVFELFGYIPRILSSQKDPYNIIYYIIQYFFIVIAPVFFSAAIYTILSIMINRTKTSQYAPLAPNLILWIFITFDVITTIIQVVGAALVGKYKRDKKDATIPNNILLAGLAIQVFSFLVFLLCLNAFLYRARKVIFQIAGLFQFTVAFYIATLMVYLRTCFRLAETAQGLMKSLSTHEVYFGCLEFAPIVLAVTILAIWHPGQWLHSNRLDENVSKKSTVDGLSEA